VADYHKKIGVPFKHWQLDSWWYPKVPIAHSFSLHHNSDVAQALSLHYPLRAGLCIMFHLSGGMTGGSDRLLISNVGGESGCWRRRFLAE